MQGGRKVTGVGLDRERDWRKGESKGGVAAIILCNRTCGSVLVTFRYNAKPPFLFPSR